jgi:transcriptional regulator with XRE-family HTH domain
MVTIESRLKEIRKFFGLNQSDFAKKINITQSTYSGIEIGREKLTERNKDLIYHVYGVNKEWLLTGEGVMLNPTKLTLDEKRLLEVFDKLEPEGKKEVQKYAEERLDLQNLKKDEELKGEKSG